MFRPLPSRFTLVAAGLAVAALTSSAHAFEHITLRNGFTYDCSHREPIDSTHVRLFLQSSDGSQSENYIDQPIDAIASVDILPDPPKAAAPTASIAAPATPKQFTADDIPALLSEAGNKYQIDVALLASVLHAESGGRITAVSRAGARGLMQLMPGTAHDLGVEDSFRPDQNIAGGTAYLNSLLKLYNDDVQLALAAYNAGPAAIARYHNHVPPFPETRAYVSRVINEFNRRIAARSATTIASR